MLTNEVIKINLFLWKSYLNCISLSPCIKGIWMILFIHFFIYISSYILFLKIKLIDENLCMPPNLRQSLYSTKSCQSFLILSHISYVLNVEALHHRGPRSRQMDAPFSIEDDSCFDQPAKDVRTGCSDTPSDGFVSFFSDNQSSFFLSKKAYLLSLHEGAFIVSEALSPLMVGRLFGLSWWRWGSGRAIIALQAAVRNRRGDDLPSFLSFRSAVDGMQAMTGCLKWLSMVPSKVLLIVYIRMARVSRPRLLIKLLTLGSDNISGQESGSSGSWVWECRTPSGGNPDRELMCHMSPGGVLCGIATWAFGDGPYNAPLLTWLFCPGKKGGLKMMLLNLSFLFWGLCATWCCKRGSIYGESPFLGGFLGGMSFRQWHGWAPGCFEYRGVASLK